MPFDFDSLWEFASVTDPSVLRVLLKSSPDWAIATTGSRAVPAAPAGRFHTTSASGDHEPDAGE
jgi:hypothetical protein